MRRYIQPTPKREGEAFPSPKLLFRLGAGQQQRFTKFVYIVIPLWWRWGTEIAENYKEMDFHEYHSFSFYGEISYKINIAPAARTCISSCIKTQNKH